MKISSLSPEILAAQALGEVDKVTGALIPTITLSTNDEQESDGARARMRIKTFARDERCKVNETVRGQERVCARLPIRQVREP